MNATQVRAPTPSSRGFTLLEMLAVIGIVLVLLAIAMPTVNSLRSTALQVGARQVSSGMQLARQYAINYRVPVRFVIAVTNSSGAIRNDLVCRAYTVLAANLDPETGQPVSWGALEDWTLLPQGVVFSDLNTTYYDPINSNATNNSPPPVGLNSRIIGAATDTTNAWQYYDGVMSDLTVGTGAVTSTWTVCGVEFKATGQVSTSFAPSITGATGIRLSQGTVTDPNGGPQVAIADSANWVYIECDRFGGRVRTRYKDSYR